MHIASQDGHANIELGSDPLKFNHQLTPLFLVRSRSVVVIQIVQQINTTVKLVKQTSSESESSVEDLDRAHDWTTEDVLKPSQALKHVSLTAGNYFIMYRNTYRIRNGNTKEQNYVLDWLSCCRCRFELRTESCPDLLVCLGVIDLVTCALCFELAAVSVGTRCTDLYSCINTDKSNTGSKTGIDVIRTFSDIWTGM